MSELKIPNDASDEAKICLLCDIPLSKCKNPLSCKRYKEESKKIEGKRRNNIVIVNKKAGGWK